MDTCYLCGTNQEVSIKKTNRDGSRAFICRPCRNKQHKAWRSKSPLLKPKLHKVDTDYDNGNWNRLAYASHERILTKYGQKMATRW